MRCVTETTSVLACPDDRTALQEAGSDLQCPLCRRQFTITHGIYNLLPSQCLHSGSSDQQRINDYDGTYSQRLDHWWTQGVRVLVAKLGNAYLYSWAAHAIKRIAAGRSLSILDAACGQGILRRYIAKKHEYNGVDFSIRPLIRAAHYQPAHYFRGDLNHLPFVNTNFDLAVSLQAFQYLERPADAVHELARVLKPGGYFLLTVPNCRSVKYRLQGTPSIQLQHFDREYLLRLLSPEFEVQEISTRGLWLPAPKISLHLAGRYPLSWGLSWTVLGMRRA